MTLQVLVIASKTAFFQIAKVWQITPRSLILIPLLMAI